MLFLGYGIEKVLFLRMMLGINTIISNHFKMLFRNMLNKLCDKLHNGNCFFDEFVVLMALVMESKEIAIIAINAR